MLSSAHAIRTLIERLNWPVRFARWRAAKELAGLLSSPQRDAALETLFEWLETRSFETEVVAGLTIFLCAQRKELPPAETVRCRIKKSSILAELLFQRLYGEPLGGWGDAHSGPAPLGFSPDRYFEKHIGQVIPGILSTELERLEQQTGLPFHAQWAFEWQSLMDATNAPYSSFPYHFVNSSGPREGLSAQVSQVQCDVYRSAFLRTLSFAVSEWGMPSRAAAFPSAFCLPLSDDIHSLMPISRPAWLGDVPEKCSKPGAKLEKLVRQLVKPNIGTKGMSPISLRVPISTTIAEFGELRIETFLVTDDFVPNDEFEDRHPRLLFWHSPNFASFEGLLPNASFEDFRFEGTAGSCVPMCLDVWPSHFGFWQNDYVRLGFAFPAPYLFSDVLGVECVRGWVGFSSKGRRAGYWKTWHDNWAPIEPVEGHTRCGGLTELRTQILDEAAEKFDMRMAWQVTVKTWERTSEFSAPKPTTRSAFFN
jgi:hypothetical protein